MKVVDPLRAGADEGLPLVRAALDAGRARAALEARLGPIELRTARVTRHKRARRCVVEYDVVLAGEPATLVGKARAKGADRETFALHEALVAAGFDASSAHGVSVPEPVALVPELGMWLQRKVAGVPAGELLPGPGGARAARRVAEALHTLHEAGVPARRRHTVEDELRILRARLGALSEPALAARVRRVLDGCERLGGSIGEAPRVGIHRDFYHDQVLLDGERVYIVDLDLYSEGDGALDAGNFLAHCTELGLRTAGALAGAEAAFATRYAELAGGEERVRAFATLALARHIAISTLFPERRGWTAALVDLCEGRLRAAETVWT
jgi:hypothetical protein